jgi:hypothetical protein
VVIGVHNLEGSIAQYRKAFDLPAAKRQRDEAFGADLAWFEGTPVVLAVSLTSSSWLARRIGQYGDSPCAFVFTADKGLTGWQPANWFGRPVFWAGDANPGWRIGRWIAP